MRIGVSKILITPVPGIDLAGFGRPGRKASGVHDDLFLSSMAIESANKRVLLICADIIGFDRDFARLLKKEISNKYGFSEEEILLGASHTHSGPQTMKNMLCAGEEDNEYMEFLKERALLSVKSAMEGMNAADIYYGVTKCHIGVNRRRITDGVLEFAPDETGITDDDVTVLKIIEDGTVKAVLYNYTCHPSIIDSDDISSDYPGRTRHEIEEAFGKDVVVFFLQGFCGDIRARTIENREFRAGTWEDVDGLGFTLGESIVDLCGKPMKKLQVSISSRLLDISLPLAALPKKRKLAGILKNGTVCEKVWAEKLLLHYGALQRSVPFTIQRITLGNVFHIVAMSGEVCVEYAKYIKQSDGKKIFIAAGYSNGVVGYIPTGRMLEQGGYEPVESTLYYSLPSCFEKSVEKVVLGAINSILDDCMDSSAGSAIWPVPK